MRVFGLTQFGKTNFPPARFGGSSGGKNMETMDLQNSQEELSNYLESLPEDQANEFLDELAEELAKAMALQIIRSQIGVQVGLVLPRISSQLSDIRNLLRQELKNAGTRTDYRTASGSPDRFVAVG